MKNAAFSKNRKAHLRLSTTIFSTIFSSKRLYSQIWLQ